MMKRRDDIAIVIVGRNEGHRLARSLAAACEVGVLVVYVDSGSTDGSSDLARRFGAMTLDLDRSRPFTAARARNEGFTLARRLLPSLQYVQFVDGDCELAPGWVEIAREALRTHTEFAVVAGRLRERNRAASVYNLLCDMEWSAPAGETDSCGGNCMVRASAFAGAGGFDPSLIAGEEPELAWRLRTQGWKLWRIDSEMASHDAEIQRLSQWWKRQVRAGHAAMENADLHGRRDHNHFIRDVASNMFYGLFVPLVAIGLALPTAGLSLTSTAVYVRLHRRIRRHRLARGDAAPDATRYATFTVLGKFAQSFGSLLYLWRRKVVRRASTLIEYKHPSATDSIDSFLG